MKHTCVGLVASNDGLACDFTRQRSAWASPADEYRTVQPGRIPVDIDHDGRQVGHVVHLERQAAGIWAVAELDVPEPALYVRVGNDRVALRDPTYFSALRAADSDDRDLELVGVAICHRTARLGATPLQWFEGDLGSKGSWHTNSFLRPLLHRANETRHTRHGGPLIVHGTDPSHTAPPAYSRDQAGPLLLRSAETLDVSEHARIIELIVMPYETPALVAHKGRMVSETIARGAFDGIEQQRNRIRANRDHNVERTVGVATRLDPHDHRGLHAEVQIARTDLGDETLALAAGGCLDASAAFRPTPDGLRWQGRDAYTVDKAWLGHIALTPDPAYETARVLAVRAGA